MLGGRGSDPEEEPMEAQPTSVLVVGGSLAAKVAAYTCGQALNAALGRPLRGLAPLLV